MFWHQSRQIGPVHSSHPPHVRCSTTPKSNFCHELFAAERKAGLVMSEPYVISALCTPPMGLFVDRFGGRALLVVVAPAILLAVHFAKVMCKRLYQRRHGTARIG